MLPATSAGAQPTGAQDGQVLTATERRFEHEGDDVGDLLGTGCTVKLLQGTSGRPQPLSTSVTPRPIRSAHRWSPSPNWARAGCGCSPHAPANPDSAGRGLDESTEEARVGNRLGMPLD